MLSTFRRRRGGSSKKRKVFERLEIARIARTIFGRSESQRRDLFPKKHFWEWRMLDNVENELLVDGELPSVDAYSTWAVNHCVDALKKYQRLFTRSAKNLWPTL